MKSDVASPWRLQREPLLARFSLADGQTFAYRINITSCLFFFRVVLPVWYVPVVRPCGTVMAA